MVNIVSKVKRILKPYFIVFPYSLRRPYTIKYPYERLRFYPGFRGRHLLNLDRCIGCGTCSKICPDGSIEMVVDKDGKRKPQIDYGTCCFCGLCVDYCPRLALSMTNLVEISSKNREDLIYSPLKLSEVLDIKEIIPVREELSVEITRRGISYTKRKI